MWLYMCSFSCSFSRSTTRVPKYYQSEKLMLFKKLLSLLLKNKPLSPKWYSVSQFSRSVVSDSLWPHEPQHARPPCPSPTAARQASLSITNSRSPPKPMSIESVMPSNHLILCHPLLFLPSIFPSIRVFSNESVRIRWPKYWSFSLNISPSNEHPGLISFRMDWLNLLAVQGALKSLLQYHS